MAEELNNFFVNKIDKLKNSIDKSLIEDPLIKLKDKMENKNLKFSLKTVTEKMVSKVMRSLKKKKSTGEDEISQDVIMMGEKALLTPISHNSFICHLQVVSHGTIAYIHLNSSFWSAKC